MPAPPSPPVRPQTIKQAKAAYNKSRGRPSLSKREKRQLERAAELDRRAWRIKDAEQKRIEAAKKKAEKERKEREERQKMQMGSQRRCDRFGYKSSQLHLGAFLNGKRTTIVMQKENVETYTADNESGSFSEDDVDDESLLAAMDGTNEPKTADISALHTYTRSHDITTPPQQHPMVQTQLGRSIPPLQTAPELESFWDELGSSTQIARELESDEDELKASISFESDDFDITVEDIEEANSALDLRRSMQEDRRLMPPPPRPVKPVIVNNGYTMSQLERFLDDDVCLTQADHV